MGFFDLIFPAEAEGYVHVALFKNGKPLPGGRKFIKWPDERNKLKSLEKHADKGDLYFSPALYSRQEATRSAATGTFVTWADVDREGAAAPSASLLVESGTPGHIHAYWLHSGGLLTPAQAEAWNFYNAGLLNADMSGWDITQLLRVPGTLNHKTDPPLPVRLIHESDQAVEPPIQLDSIRVPHYTRPDIIPSVATVLESHDLNDGTLRLLQLDSPPDRSDTMYRLVCELSEQGLSADEAYAIIEAVDDKWGKFVNRSDRDTRLSQLVAKAYESTLSLIDDTVDEVPEPIPLRFKYDPFEPVGWRSLGLNVPPVNFLIDGVLVDGGFMALLGDTNVGKSQLALGLCAKLVLGATEWAGFKINVQTQQRILYLSLEMDQNVVRLTTDKMSAILTSEQLDLLDENLRFVATVASYKLDIEPTKIKGAPLVARQRLERAVAGFEGCTGVVIDTISAATSVSVQDEVRVRSVVNWIKDVLRFKYGVWVVLVSHPRKEQAGQKRKELVMDDLYGSRVIGDEMDTAFAIHRVAGNDQLLRMTNLKARLSAKHGETYLRRTPSLWLERTTEVVTAATPNKEGAAMELEDDTGFMEDDPRQW